MSIGTNDAVRKFHTSTTTAITTGSTVADGAFSLSGDVTLFTASNDAPMVAIVFTGTFSTALAAGKSVEIYARLMNIDGTKDMITPDANFAGVYVTSIPLNDQSGEQCWGRMVGLPGVKAGQEIEFYLGNAAGQTLSAGATVKVTEVTNGPKA